MTELVLDASVLVKWFKTAGEMNVAAARQLRQRFEQGELLVFVPPLLFLELLNLAARRWHWDARRLQRFAAVLGALGLAVQEPALARVAWWCGRGLTAYDACYVALAEERRTVVITADALILSTAGALAHPL